MAYDIVVGRNKRDTEKFGTEGTIYLGKHYVKMGRTTSLSNKVYMDMIRSHVVFVCGKRGGGKCVVGETLITLADGSKKRIKELEDNLEPVQCIDGAGNIINQMPSNFFKRKVKKLLRLTLSSGTSITLTPEHPLFTEKGWQQAKSLSNGARIATPQLGADAEFVVETGTQLLKVLLKDILWGTLVNVQNINEEREVYDISIPLYHNFIANDIIVHNSYTMGVIAEGMADLPEHIRKNISIIMLDTMGIYWTMKYPNMKDKELLEKWDLKPHPQDVTIFTPTGYYNKYKDEGIPTDKAFSIRPAELQGTDWTTTFDIEPNSPIGVLIQGIIHDFREAENDDYDLDDIIAAIVKDEDSTKEVKLAAKTHFAAAKGWGVFDRQGTTLKELAAPGQVTVLDVSCYATEENGWAIKSLVIGLVAQKLFNERMISRKDEEFKDVESKTSYFSEDKSDEQDFPMVWLVVDEAHEFMPNKGKTLATDPLVTILREGRQPGISLILATQQPGKIHTDVMTQSDTIISHRITAKLDTDALGMLMQSYMRAGLDVELDNLPRTKGAALILDDNNEKMYPIQIRPRFTWHGGEAPTALKKKDEMFEF